MTAELEVWMLNERTRVALNGDRITLGSAEGNDLVVADDRTVSRLHAVLERFAVGWCVTDLGSSNGTTLNGERIWGQRRLRPGDELRVGRTRLIFRDATDQGGHSTQSEAAPPTLTPREHDVLVALCRPLLARDLFTEPTSIRDVAAELVVSEAAVKQHLANLYDKFAIGDEQSHRRTRLANEALRTGAVRLADLRAADP